MGNQFVEGTYRFEIVVEMKGGEETFTLYRNIKSRTQAETYLQALLDFSDMRGERWKSARWIFDAINN
jgi:hypothetical protein